MWSRLFTRSRQLQYTCTSNVSLTISGVECTFFFIVFLSIVFFVFCGVGKISTYTTGSVYGSPITAYSSPYSDVYSNHAFEPYMGYHDATMYIDHGQHHAPEYSQFLAEHAQVATHDEAGPKIVEAGGSTDNGQTSAPPSSYRRVGRHRRRRANQQFQQRQNFK